MLKLNTEVWVRGQIKGIEISEGGITYLVKVTSESIMYNAIKVKESDLDTIKVEGE